PSRSLTDGDTVGDGGRSYSVTRRRPGCGHRRRAVQHHIGLDPHRYRLHAEARDDGPGRAGVLAPLRREGADAPAEGVDESRPGRRRLIPPRRPGDAKVITNALDVSELRAAHGLLVLPAVPAERRARVGPAPAHAERVEALA